MTATLTTTEPRRHLGWQLAALVDGKLAVVQGEGDYDRHPTHAVLSDHTIASWLSELAEKRPGVAYVAMPVFAGDVEAPIYVGHDAPSPFDHLIRAETRDAFASLIRDGELEIDENAKIYRSDSGAFVEAYIYAATTTVPFSLDDETIDVEVNRQLKSAVTEALGEFDDLAQVATAELSADGKSIAVTLTDGTSHTLRAQTDVCAEASK